MTKLVVPPMPDGWLPEDDPDGVIFSVDPICDWGSLGWQTAHREAALADELAEALRGILHGEDVDEMRRIAFDAHAKHKEARNG